MAVYTDISDAELEAFMAEFDLGAPLAFKGIAEGVSNSNFLLETERGRFILTVYEQRTDEADLPFFLLLMRWLHDHGYPSATPMPARDGALYKRVRGKPAAIVTFLNGMSARRPGVAQCREAGVGLARLHVATDGFAMSRVNTLGQPFWADMFKGYEDQAEGLKPGLAAVISADIETFARLWPQGLPQGVIHADFFPDNVFFQNGRFAAAIDFYFAWCFEPDGSLNVTAARALVAGYQSVRGLSDAEKAALPVLAWGAALRFFLTRLHDFRLGGEGALVKPHDPLEYERKLAVHRAAFSSGEGLVLF
jgi:homoserine kinase type II